jgi:hypothetical protein
VKVHDIRLFALLKVPCTVSFIIITVNLYEELWYVSQAIAHLLYKALVFVNLVGEIW